MNSNKNEIYLSIIIVVLSLLAIIIFFSIGANVIFYIIFVIVFVLMIYLMYKTNSTQIEGKSIQKKKTTKTKRKHTK